MNRFILLAVINTLFFDLYEVLFVTFFRLRAEVYDAELQTP